MNTTIPFLCLLSAKKKGMASKKERKKERKKCTKPYPPNGGHYKKIKPIYLVPNWCFGVLWHFFYPC